VLFRSIQLGPKEPSVGQETLTAIPATAMDTRMRGYDKFRTVMTWLFVWEAAPAAEC
jgi:hypothetical protein